MLCEKGSRFQWKNECEQAFIRLKDALISTLILDQVVGAVLSQVQEGKEKLIAYR
jgi:hypothetical protein